MLAYCEKCKVVIYIEEPKRYGNGSIRYHCNICGNNVFDIAGL